MRSAEKNSEYGILESIVDFPAEEYPDLRLRLYDESSLENYMAILSHYLHNPLIGLSDDEKLALVTALIRFLESKPEIEISQEEPISEDTLVNIVSDARQLDLFSDFFRVPFPNARSSRFTFIDLFAGIGGIRLPFSELGYKCVFSSEWDKHAQATYLANYGEMPFGDICRESTKRFIPDNFDLLLAGFPCQAFLIIGKMRGLKTRGVLCSLKLRLF